MPKKEGCRFLICLLTLLHLCYAVSAQRNERVTVVRGKAPFAKGKEIRISAPCDMITYYREVLAVDTIKPDGSFTLTFANDTTQLVQLAIQTSKAEFYVERGKAYQLTIDMDPQLFPLIDPMAYGGYLQIRNEDSLSTPTTEINKQIALFDYRLYDLIDYFSPNILSDMTREEVDSILYYLKEDYPLNYNPTHFFDAYCYYSIAFLERIAMQKNKDSLYIKYLDNEYLLYDNPAYMDFFNTFYDQFIYLSSHINRKALITCINEDRDYFALFNLVGNDPLLVNQRIRELVILKNLMQLYDNKNFNKESILTIIQQIKESTHFDEHKEIAQNIIHVLTTTGQGKPLPVAHFKEITGIDFNLSDYQGKWVFIQLFHTSCQDCIREMTMLKKLHEKYGEKVSIISLSLDFNLGHLLQFKEKYPQFDWSFIHFNNDFVWLDQMQITTLPDNLLIAPDGTLSQRYAPDISRDLARYFAKLFPEKEPDINPLLPQSQY